MKNAINQDSRGTLGTFGGVFTPSVLTILGIILFLRLGYVVGEAGLGRALLIIALANTISVLTTFSLSAISTNMRVKGGGDYYLISRTLGLEFGGAIGIVLFLAQSVSIGFYCIGFGEAVVHFIPEGLPFVGAQWIALLAALFLFVFAWLGADWATRFQYVVMSLLFAALISFFVGGFGKWEAKTLLENWATPANSPAFWVLFAIFFPAVTGFTQGVSMSGDLRDPGKSLPLGTFLAVGISIVVYFAVALVFAGSLAGEHMRSDYSSMRQVSFFSFIIDCGVVAATLSSAMASFLGAPRIMQSLASDRIFPALLPLAQGAGPTNNPRRAVLLSGGIALLTIALGNLNMIAPIVSMFFLVSYGLLNYATYFEARSSSPSFRPRFKYYNQYLSLMGFLACMGVMLAIDLAAGVVAISILFAIFQYLKRTAGPARWSAGRRSYHLQQIRTHLLAATAEPEHPRDWRPQILAFSDDAERRGQLLTFASWIQGGSGLTTVVRVLEGKWPAVVRARKEAEEELRKDIHEKGLPAFPLVVAASSAVEGILTLVQAYGVGPVKVNTILLNWFEGASKGVPGLKEAKYARILGNAFRMGENLVLLAANEGAWAAIQGLPPEDRRIDVWWWGDATSPLMLLLAHLMKRRPGWEEASIRVVSPAQKRSPGEVLDELSRVLEEIRIQAEPLVVEEASLDRFAEISAECSVVFLPFRLKRGKMTGPFGVPLVEVAPRVRVAAMVLAAEDIDLDAEPDEGKAAEIARAYDSFMEARDRARGAEKDAEDILSEAEEAERRINEMIEKARPGVSGEAMEEIDKAVQHATEIRNKAVRSAKRATKARVKAEYEMKRALELGAIQAEEAESFDKPSDSEEEG